MASGGGAGAAGADGTGYKRGQRLRRESLTRPGAKLAEQPGEPVELSPRSLERLKDEKLARQRERDRAAAGGLEAQYAWTLRPNASKPMRGRVSMDLIAAICADDVTTIKAWLADPITHQDDTDLDGRTALVWACREGSQRVTQELVKVEAMLNVETDEGWTALQLACCGGHLGCVKQMVHAVRPRGCVRLNQTRGPEGWVAIVDAARYGHKDIVDLLHQAGCDMDMMVNGSRVRDYCDIGAASGSAYEYNRR